MPINEPPTIADKSIVSINIIECHEPLVSLSEILKTTMLDSSVSNIRHLRYNPDFRLRETTASRLFQAELLLPSDIKLFIKECYRPLDIQHQYFDAYLGRLRKIRSDLSESDLRIEAAKYVAPPEFATHATGGAFDVTLIYSSEELVDMGTVYDAEPSECDNACFTDAPNISPQAKKNRVLLKACLENVGFANYPYEWWHWSFGDRYWAYSTGQNHAIYGPVE